MVRTLLAVARADCMAVPCIADVTLIRDGQPVPHIIVPAAAADTITLAADELNLRLRLMAGSELPAVPKPGTAFGVKANGTLSELDLK